MKRKPLLCHRTGTSSQFSSFIFPLAAEVLKSSENESKQNILFLRPVKGKGKKFIYPSRWGPVKRLFAPPLRCSGDEHMCVEERSYTEDPRGKA